MLAIQPINFDEACLFVSQLHRHHRPPQGYKLCLAVNDGERVVGVIIAGRPVARHLDDGLTLEVTRCCVSSDIPRQVDSGGKSHSPNACSILYSACWRAAKSIGYTRMVTYTLPEEGGASLRACGARFDGDAGGTPWTNSKRTRSDDHPQGVKHRWVWHTDSTVKRFRLKKDKPVAKTLFD